MEYLTTKELAEKWEISVSRIVRLAKAGRIPGARRVGSSWAFPPDTQKPADQRRRGALAAAPAFRFPLYLYHSYSERQINDEFTPDEAALYHAQTLYLHADYSQCIRPLTALIKQTADRYVRYGALYYLSLSYLMLENYPASVSCYIEMNSLFAAETLHRPEIELLISDLGAFFHGMDRYLNASFVNLPGDYPKEMNGFLAVTSLYADLLRQSFVHSQTNLTPYVVLCSGQSADFSPFAQTMLNAYLGVLLYGQGRTEQSCFYIQKACRLAEEHGILHELIYACSLFGTVFDAVLRDWRPDLLRTLHDKSDNHLRIWLNLTEYLQKDSFFVSLTQEDYKLILYAKQQTPHKAIADELGISIPGVSRKFAQLYEKTGTRSKKELYDRFFKKLCQYDIGIEEILP